MINPDQFLCGGSSKKNPSDWCWQGHLVQQGNPWMRGRKIQDNYGKKVNIKSRFEISDSGIEFHHKERIDFIIPLETSRNPGYDHIPFNRTCANAIFFKDDDHMIFFIRIWSLWNIPKMIPDLWLRISESSDKLRGSASLSSKVPHEIGLLKDWLNGPRVPWLPWSNRTWMLKLDRCGWETMFQWNS